MINTEFRKGAPAVKPGWDRVREELMGLERKGNKLVVGTHNLLITLYILVCTYIRVCMCICSIACMKQF